MAQASEQDIAFGKTAVSRGMVSKAQVEEGLKALRSGQTLARDLGAWLAEKGYLTPVQVELVTRELTSHKPKAERLGNYELIDLVGKGGMGKVYRARQVTMDRVVALKVLDPDRTANEAFRKRFIREARAAAALNHANIVRAIDAGEEKGVLYFVMEYIEAENVSEILAKSGPMDENRAVEIAIQIARALAHASRHNLVHRDIKPENILIDLGGVAKLTDLGLAKSTDAGGEVITQTGRAMGTPYYISPEQIQLVKDLDVRADIYALGATLYQMLTGHPPYYAESPAAVVSMHLTAPFVHPRTHNPALSDGVCAVVERMMQKDRGQRYQSADELIDALESLRYGAPQGGGHWAAAAPVAPAPPAGAAAPSAAPSFADPGVSAPAPPAPGKAGTGTLLAILVLGSVALVVFLLILTSGGDDEEKGSAYWVDEGGESGEPEPGKPDKPRKPDRPAPPSRTPAKPAPDNGAGAYNEAKAYVEAHGADYRGCMERLRSVMADYGDSSFAIHAKRDLEKVKSRLDKEAGQALRAIRRDAGRLSMSKRYGDALALFDKFPEHLALESWPRKVARNRERILDEGKREVERVLRFAREFVKRRKFLEAEHYLQRAAEYGVPGTAELIETERKAVARARTGKATDTFLAEFFEATRSRNLLKAEDHLARWTRSPEAGEIEDLLQACRKHLRTLRDVLARRSSGLRSRKNRPLDLLLKNGRLVTGRLAGLEEGKVEVVLPGAAAVKTSFEVDDLGNLALKDLLRGPAEDWVKLAVFQAFYGNDFELARQALARARKDGTDVVSFAGLLARLEKKRIEARLRSVERQTGSDSQKSLLLLAALLDAHRGAEGFAGFRDRCRKVLSETGARKEEAGFALDSAAHYNRVGERTRQIYDFGSAVTLKELTVRGTGFSVMDGALHQAGTWTEGGVPEVVLPGRWDAGTVEMEVRVHEHARWTGIVFCDTGGGSRVVFQLIHTIKRPLPDRFYLGFFTPEKTSKGGILFEGGLPVLAVSDKALYSASSFAFNRYHRLRVRFSPGKAWGYLDGKLVCTAEIPGFRGGSVAVRMGSPGTVRSVSVTYKEEGR